MKVPSSKVKLFSHGKFLAEHLKDGCKDLKTDLLIQCIDGNVHLHKVILGAKMVSSSLLRALKSSSVEDETLTIIIPEVKREFVQHLRNLLYTGKSFSEALILASTNPQYDKRLFIALPVQCMKTTSSEHVVHINCFTFCFDIQNNLCMYVLMF